MAIKTVKGFWASEGTEYFFIPEEEIEIKEYPICGICGTVFETIEEAEKCKILDEKYRLRRE